MDEEKREFIEKVNHIWDNTCKQARMMCYQKVKGSDVIYGESFEDLFQHASLTLIKGLHNLYDTGGNYEIKLNGRYFASSVLSNFQQGMYKANERSSRINKIDKEDPIASEESQDGIEQVEIKDLIAKSSGKTKAMILLLQRGDETTKSRNLSVLAMNKLGLKSTHQYYKVRENMKDYLIRNGFEEK